MPEHHHRAGSLRQSNKRNKRSKSSKRSISRNAGGKVMGVKGAVSAMAAQSKADRRNMAQQKRDSRRQEMMRKKRIGIDGSCCPPRLIGIISLGRNHDIEDRLRSFIVEGADKVVKTHEKKVEATVSCHFDAYKKDGKLTVLTCQSFAHQSGEMTDDDAVFAALDLARVCDMILLVIDGNTARIEGNITEICIGGDEEHFLSTNKSRFSQDWDHLISGRGDRILSAIKAQGLPTPVTVLAHNEKDALDHDHMTMQSVKSLRRSKIKRQHDLRKYVNRFAATEFGNQYDKVIEIDLHDSEDTELDSMDIDVERERNLEAAKLVRAICTMSCSPAKWVSLSPRSYLVTDTYDYDPASKELHLTGYIRGMAPFDVNALVHVPHLGTYTCKSVQKLPQPLSGKSRQIIETEKEIIFSDPEIRENLSMFATPDSLDGEQNLIGFDEENDVDDSDEKEKFARPAGWSDYQSAWLDAVDGDPINNDEEADHGELAEELNKKSTRGGSKASEGITDTMELDDANDISASERKALFELRKKQLNEENDFPDEVQVDEDVKARERYARYRSLKSFRKSQWDPKENLPETYANIFHFSSFKQTQRSVMNDMKELVRESDAFNGQFWGGTPSRVSGHDDSMMKDEDCDDDFLNGCIPSGSYIVMTLNAVPEEAMKDKIIDNSLLTAVSLLQHENKVSVLHVGLSQSAKCDSTKEHPVKSKDILTFRCGWRTWSARPVFSQNNLNCDKHKFERFLPTDGAFFAASFFGPVTYTPCPVLVFREHKDSSQKKDLIAHGSMMGADADRIVVKRILLTGYPVKVQKRHATVKYMFYNPEDVKWFKPAGLHTKHGLQGNIVQSVGEHGTMKCLFNAPIKQHDTVCLPLYKRIFPKYVPSNKKDEESGTLIIR